MKFFVFLLLMASGGLGYAYYQKNKSPVQETAPAMLTDAQKRSQQREALTAKVDNLRTELFRELIQFRDGVEYNGQTGNQFYANGRMKRDRGYIGNPTRYQINETKPENTDWINGPDFGLRRASELRREILSTQAALARLD